MRRARDRSACRVCAVLAAVILFFILATAARAAAERLIELPTRPGVTVPLLVTAPTGPPAAVVLLFPGGTGRVELWKFMPPRSENFVVRARALFAAAGFLTVTVDVPSDRRHAGMTGFRGSAGHREDIAAVLGWARRQTSAPVWLVGTSRGTISVAYLASALKVDGSVLSSTVTRPGNRGPATVLDANLGKITAPVLLVHNRDDACRVSPPSGVAAVRRRLVSSRKVEVLLFSGGAPPQAGPCHALSRHGYIGIENKVVAAVAAHIRALTPPPRR